MLKEKIDISIISTITGLTEEKIEEYNTGQGDE